MALKLEPEAINSAARMAWTPAPIPMFFVSNMKVSSIGKSCATNLTELKVPDKPLEMVIANTFS
jgi:hypothetical protein